MPRVPDDESDGRKALGFSPKAHPALRALAASSLVDELSRHGFHISGASLSDEYPAAFKYWVSRYRGGPVVAIVTGSHIKKPKTVTYGEAPKELVSICTLHGDVESGGPLQPKLPTGLEDVSGHAVVQGKWWWFDLIMLIVLLALIVAWLVWKAG